MDQKPGQVFLPHMAKQYTIKLEENDLGQILDGLQVRADSWRRTAEYLKTGEMSDDSFFIIEECSDHEEAGRFSARYEDIIENLCSQMRKQV